MTRKDYVAIAKTLTRFLASPDEIAIVAKTLAATFENFDKEKFWAVAFPEVRVNGRVQPRAMPEDALIPDQGSRLDSSSLDSSHDADSTQHFADENTPADHYYRS